MARSSGARRTAPEEVVYRSEPLERQTRFADDKKTTRRPTLTAAQKRKQATLTQIDFVSTPQLQSDDDDEEQDVRPKKRRRRTTAEERRRQSTLTQIDFFKEVVDSEEGSDDDEYNDSSEQELGHEDGHNAFEQPKVSASYDSTHEQEQPPVSAQRSASQQPHKTHSANCLSGSLQARVKFESPTTPVTVRKHTIPSSQSPADSPLLTQQSTRGSRHSTSRRVLTERSANLQTIDETPSKLRFRVSALKGSGRAAQKETSAQTKDEPTPTQHVSVHCEQGDTECLEFADSSMDESVREELQSAFDNAEGDRGMNVEAASMDESVKEEFKRIFRKADDREVIDSEDDDASASDFDQQDEEAPGLTHENPSSTPPRHNAASSLAVQTHETQHTEQSIATSTQERARAEQAATQLLQEDLASRHWRDVSRTQASTLHHAPATQVPSSFPTSQTTANTSGRTPRAPQTVLESPVKTSLPQWPDIVPSSPFPVPPLSSPPGWRSSAGRSSAGSPSSGHFAPDSLINYTLEPPPPLSDDEDEEL